MIAVQTNDRLYLLNMDDSEFVSLAMQETMAGRNVEERLIPLIRARSGISFNSNDMVRFANTMIPEISTCFSQVGNRFDTKTVSSTGDLEFFVTPDGVQYSCEEAYIESQVSMGERQSVPNPVVEAPIPNPLAEEQRIPNPVAGEQQIPNPVVEVENEEPSLEIPNPTVAPISTEEPYIGVVPGEQIQKASGVIALPASLNDEFYRRDEEAEIDPEMPTSLIPVESRILDESDLETIQIKEEQKRAASQLDNIVRNLPSVTNLPEEVLDGMRNYIGSQKSIFRGYAEEYLNNISPLDRDELLTEFPVSNALGHSHDMVDSLLVFPVHTHILAKKDLTARFSALDLINSTMVRVCPIGISGEKIQSYVQEIKITSQDVKEAEEMVKAELKKQGKSKRSLTSKEKYDLMEDALEQIYKNRKGSLAASRETKLVEDLGRHFDRMVSASKVYIPSLEEWNSYDVFAYDARTKIDEFPMPLLTQLQNINGKTVEEVSTIYGGPSEDPFAEELTDENNLGENAQGPRTVKIFRVDTSEEAIREGRSNGLEATFVSENYLSETERDSIIAISDEYVLDGYFFDVATNEVITELEYEEAISKVNVAVTAPTPQAAQEENKTVVVYGVDGHFERLSLDEISEEMQKYIVTEFGLAHIPDYYYDFTSKTFVSKKEFDKDKVYIEGFGSLETEAVYENDVSYVSYDTLTPELQAKVVTNREGSMVLEGYYYDSTNNTFFTLEELDRKIQERKAATVRPNIPNPIAEPAPVEDKSTEWTIPDRKFRQPITVSIPTVFSKGMTAEKIEKLPEYREYVTLSEDDMSDALKACIRPTDNGYVLEGYCYDYDQVKLIPFSEYFQAASNLLSGAQEEQIPSPIVPLQEDSSKGFEPIIGAPETMNVSMGGIPIGGEAVPEQVSKEKKDATQETLTDYVKPDGTYVDPNGEEWSSKDEYTLYKLLSDDQFLSDEEQKGKQF